MGCKPNRDSHRDFTSIYISPEQQKLLGVIFPDEAENNKIKKELDEFITQFGKLYEFLPSDLALPLRDRILELFIIFGNNVAQLFRNVADVLDDEAETF